jgi:hypothetical protein
MASFYIICRQCARALFYSPSPIRLQRNTAVNDAQITCRPPPPPPPIPSLSILPLLLPALRDSLTSQSRPGSTPGCAQGASGEAAEAAELRARAAEAEAKAAEAAAAVAAAGRERDEAQAALAEMRAGQRGRWGCARVRALVRACVRVWSRAHTFLRCVCVSGGPKNHP